MMIQEGARGEQNSCSIKVQRTVPVNSTIFIEVIILRRCRKVFRVDDIVPTRGWLPKLLPSTCSQRTPFSVLDLDDSIDMIDVSSLVENPEVVEGQNKIPVLSRCGIFRAPHRRRLVSFSGNTLSTSAERHLGLGKLRDFVHSFIIRFWTYPFPL